MAPSKAIERAGASSCRAESQSNAGSAGMGNCAGMPPKRLPIVSTGKSKATTASVPRPRATTLAGTLPVNRFHDLGAARGAPAPWASSCVADRVVALVQRGHSRRTISEASATATAQGLRSFRVCPMMMICEKKLDGIRSIGKPKRSRTCCRAIRTAMPLVNPTMIETGTNRIRTPIRRAPMAKSTTPAIMVATSKLAMP